VGSVDLPPEYPADVVLRDGSTVQVRPVRPDDREAIAEFLRGLSKQSLCLRYFTNILDADRAARSAVDVDYRRRFGLMDYGGTRGPRGGTRGVGGQGHGPRGGGPGRGRSLPGPRPGNHPPGTPDGGGPGARDSRCSGDGSFPRTTTCSRCSARAGSPFTCAPDLGRSWSSTPRPSPRRHWSASSGGNRRRRRPPSVVPGSALRRRDRGLPLPGDHRRGDLPQPPPHRLQRPRLPRQRQGRHGSDRGRVTARFGTSPARST
jgi:hypothetical protein